MFDIGATELLLIVVVAILVIGLALLAEALRMLIRRRFIAALVWLLIGLVTLSWLIH